MTELARWANFFVIVGSSAGALIGLQFVVITLVAAMPRTPGQEHAGRTYATPTIVHFATVLLLSGLLSAPWRGIIGPAVVCGILGASGIVYSFVVTRRMRIQTGYTPEFEDWLCHALLPLSAYAILTASACGASTALTNSCSASRPPLFCCCLSESTTPGMALHTMSG